MKMFLSIFFHVVRMLILIKCHKHQRTVGSICVSSLLRFFSFISITRLTPEEKTDCNWKLHTPGFY